MAEAVSPAAPEALQSDADAPAAAGDREGDAAPPGGQTVRGGPGGAPSGGHTEGDSPGGAPSRGGGPAEAGAVSARPPAAGQIPGQGRAAGQLGSGLAGGQEAVQPRHAPDPYGTPPYGEPGPWAPAPPVQRPVATPAHGTHIPPAVTAAAAPHPVPAPAATPPGGTPLPPVATPLPAGAVPRQATGQWQHYDPPPAFGGGGSGSVPGPAAIAAVGSGLEPPASRTPRRAGSLLVGALLLALVSGGIGGGIGAYIERTGGITEVRLPQADAEPRDRDPESVAGIAATALPGVVTLHVQGGDKQAGTGTGFVLDRRGHILTNNHVVQPAGSDGEISVTFSGGEVAGGEVVGRDTGYDLAVVRVKGVSGLKPLTLGNSDSVRVGDPVVAIGAPYDLAGTVTAGIISAKERPITAGGQKGDGSDVSYVDALQTDAPINPGNSGGPLVDSQARVIGINSAIKAADSGLGDGLDGAQGGSIGLGFAIPINQGKRVAEELINTGEATHPVIGVTLDMEYTGDGARVGTKSTPGSSPVTPGGPSDKAGIEPGDVITEVDGARVHSGEELIVKIRSHRPGDRLELTLERDGKKRALRLVLGTANGG
ncbi:trypsin-like peptidase domain-containing protein [Streptomyces sp. KR80]|uniref:trypsin-like peptidase domain-containing protein n=1 Tax=Streptomyces sp. KR80 TaxID=3457426 RepID=UPI003FD6332A